MSDGPEFNLSELSWKDSKALSLHQLSLQKAQAERDVAGVADGFASLEAFLARVVVSVPREWLVTGAPAQIRWSDPASFDWVKARRMGELLTALSSAQTPETAAKN